ncbi:MAG: putative toxin-antitoxin system toxin component, PIN family [Tepidimonas sp.]
MSRCFIIDTNVLAAGLITGDRNSPTAQILDAMLAGRLPFLLSPALLDEYRCVLLRSKRRRVHGLTEADIDTILTEIVANALWRGPPDDRLHTTPDPGDAHLWALLAMEPTAALVTGDRLLHAHPRPGSTIISPADCLPLINP